MSLAVILKGGFVMFWVDDTNGKRHKFDAIQDMKEYIENRHAEEGGTDWISEIADKRGNYYGCTWKLEIEEI